MPSPASPPPSKKYGKKNKNFIKYFKTIISWVKTYDLKTENTRKKTKIHKKSHKPVNTVDWVYFACYYCSRFSRFELHSRKIQDRENFNVDYFYHFRPFFVYFGCFFGYMSSSVVTGFRPFAKITCSRNIPVLQ